jgi:hypothetical protein
MCPCDAVDPRATITPANPGSYDRYCDDASANATRTMCSGEALIMIGSAADPYFVERETGLRSHFRHQHFLLFLIPHFYKAADARVHRPDNRDRDGLRVLRRGLQGAGRSDGGLLA